MNKNYEIGANGLAKTMELVWWLTEPGEFKHGQ